MLIWYEQFFERCNTTPCTPCTRVTRRSWLPSYHRGDFNIHVEDQTNHDATLLADRLESFGLVQHVNGATHKYGGTLDLIISGSDVAIESVEVDPPGIISDHALVPCCLQAREHPIRRSTKFVKSWRRVDRSVLLEAIRNSPLGCSPTTSCPVELFEVYHSTLTEIADRLALAHSTQSRMCPLSPWFDAECRSIRRNCRRLENNIGERKMLCTGWSGSNRSARNTRRSGTRRTVIAKEKYLMRRGSHQSCGSHCRPYFAETRTGHPLHQSTRRRISWIFFKRRSPMSGPAPAGNARPEETDQAESSLTGFQEDDDVRMIIMASPTKSCSLDPVPTFILKEVLDVLLPYLTHMCNASLSGGQLPVSQRHAIITPLLKK